MNPITQFSTTVGLMLALLTAPPAIGWAAPSVSSLENQLKKSPQDTRVREALGAAWLKAKNDKNAIAVLSPYANEISSEGLMDLATAYRNTKDDLNEIRILKLFVEKSPKRFRPYFLLGQALARSKKYDEAASSLRESIQYAPKHRPSYDALLNIFIETKQNYESRILLTEMTRAFGEKKEFLNLLCKLYAIDNFLKEAQGYCQRAISATPQFPDNHIYLAQTYYNQDNKVAAERIFRTAGKQFIKSEFVQYAAGEYYLNEKNYPTAVRYLENAVRVNPDTKRAQFTLGLALYELKEYARALSHLEKSCRLDKTNETVTLLKNSAARLRQAQLNDLASQYNYKAATCQSR
jgi:tetratricopeptide (TPR) repeat protein